MADSLFTGTMTKDFRRDTIILYGVHGISQTIIPEHHVFFVGSHALVGSLTLNFLFSGDTLIGDGALLYNTVKNLKMDTDLKFICYRLK